MIDVTLNFVAFSASWLTDIMKIHLSVQTFKIFQCTSTESMHVPEDQGVLAQCSLIFWVFGFPF